MTVTTTERRNLFRVGGTGLGLMAAGAWLDAPRAAAQAAPTSLLRTVLDRGKLIVGTGSTNPPWHFEDDKGQLTGMDIAMARSSPKVYLMTKGRSSTSARRRMPAFPTSPLERSML